MVVRASLQLPEQLQKYADNQSWIPVEGTTYLELIRDAARRYPPLGQRLLDPQQNVFHHWVLLVNQKPLAPGQLDVPVQDDDSDLELFGVASGG